MGIFKQDDREAPLRYHLHMVRKEVRESAVRVVLDEENGFVRQR